MIEAVQNSEEPILLFIDEAHTLIGAGNSAGGADAANLLKPALARGELRTIAATTWSEYKQYFEKDAALERRFQMVKVEEPDDESAFTMLRGLKQRYAAYHKVHIQDSAVIAAVQLSRKYITGRQLPDKAVDLLDTAAARVRMSLDTVPHIFGLIGGTGLLAATGIGSIGCRQTTGPSERVARRKHPTSRAGNCPAERTTRRNEPPLSGRKTIGGRNPILNGSRQKYRIDFRRAGSRTKKPDRETATAGCRRRRQTADFYQRR